MDLSTIKGKAEYVVANLGNVPEDSQSFAKDLCTKMAASGAGSWKQEYWVNKLYAMAASPAAVEVAAPKTVGEFTGVYALFAKAKEHLKAPKIWLRLKDGSPIMLYLSGIKSKFPGTVQVTDGQGWGGKWYGRVGIEGAISSKSFEYPETPEVVELLKKLAANPAEVAAEYGKLSGKCCFCHKTLTDEKSTAAGYGPVCAGKFGLTTTWKTGKNLLKKESFLTPDDVDKFAKVQAEEKAAAKLASELKVTFDVAKDFDSMVKAHKSTVPVEAEAPPVAVDWPTENAGKAFKDVWAAKKNTEAEPEPRKNPDQDFWF